MHAWIRSLTSLGSGSSSRWSVTGSILLADLFGGRGLFGLALLVHSVSGNLRPGLGWRGSLADSSSQRCSQDVLSVLNFPLL